MAAPVPSPDSSSSLRRHTLVAAIAKGFPDLKQFVQPTAGWPQQLPAMGLPAMVSKPKAGWPQQLPAMGLPAMVSKPKAGWPQQLPSGLAGHQDPRNESVIDTDCHSEPMIPNDTADDQSEDADATVTVPLPIPLHEYLRQLLPSDMPESTESDKVLILVKAKISTGGPRGQWVACSMSSSVSESAPLLKNVLDRVRYRGQLISHNVDDCGVLWCRMATVAQAKRLASRLDNQKVMTASPMDGRGYMLECLQASPARLPPGVAPSGQVTRGKFEAAPKVSAHHNSGPYAQPQDHGGKAKARGGVRNRPMPGGKGRVPNGAAGGSGAGYSV
jgi:hypothetical protein